MKSLVARAWIALVVLGGLVAALIFACAGTLRYWQAWVFLVIFLGASALTTQYVSSHDRALLERRMKGGPTAEKRVAQQVIMLFTLLGFTAIFVISALDRRYGWSDVPSFIVLLANAIVAAGFYIVFLVYKENTFSSATIEVAAGQKVITTGPYAIVRHPMYAGGLLYLIATPLALGSYWGLVPFALTFPFLIWRLFDEERLLTEQLPGYVAYKERVRRRLLPGIW